MKYLKIEVNQQISRDSDVYLAVPNSFEGSRNTLREVVNRFTSELDEAIDDLDDMDWSDGVCDIQPTNVESRRSVS